MMHLINKRIRKYVKIVLKKFLNDVLSVWCHSLLKYIRNAGLVSGFLAKGNTVIVYVHLTNSTG